MPTVVGSLTIITVSFTKWDAQATSEVTSSVLSTNSALTTPFTATFTLINAGYPDVLTWPDTTQQTALILLPSSVLAAGVSVISSTVSSSIASSSTSESTTSSSTTGGTVSSSTTGATGSSTALSSGISTSNTTTPDATSSATGPPTTSAASKASPSAHGLADGAVAGIAIATLIVGLALGALLAFVLLRKQRRSKGSGSVQSSVTHQGFEYDPKGPTSAFTPPAPAPTRARTTVKDDHELAHFLTAPASDNDLSRELQSLGYLVQQHVENNYHVKPIPESQGSVSEALYDIGQGDTAAIVAPLVLNPETRHAAIQHTIASAIFASLTFGGRAPISLLPASAAAFSREHIPVQSGQENAEVVLFAQNRWRQLTSFLLNTNRTDRSALVPRPEAGQKASQLASSLGRFLGPFVDPREATKQTGYLQQVIMECTKYGYVVFSQPGEYRFVFESHKRDLVTHPGLELVRDEQGRKLSNPITVLAPMVMGE